MKRITSSIIAALMLGCGGSLVGTETVVAPSHESIRYEGRFEWVAEEGPQYSLPGSRIRLQFSGTSARARIYELSGPLDDYGQQPRNHYDVIIDGERHVLTTEPGDHTYLLAEGLPKGAHSLELFKRTETWIGEGQFRGFMFDEGAKVTAPPTRNRRIEFIGDAVTVGLGVAGPGVDCDYAAEFQNHASAHPTLIANALEAEQISVAASGVGVAVNWKGDTDNTMPRIYERALLSRPESRWSFAWKPHAVVVNLGTSDFTRGDPGRVRFVNEYVSLLERVRGKYPDAFILVVTGPTLTDTFPAGVTSATLAREYTEDAVSHRKAAGDASISLLHLPTDDGARGYGCDYHPSAATQAVIAELVAAELRSKLGW